jgi:uncharacterized protein YjbI with pentapeptide repeats
MLHTHSDPPLGWRNGIPIGNAAAQGIVDGSVHGPRECDLRSARLCDANLSGMNLRHAKLVNADLRDACLVGVDLSYADLSGALLHRADMSRSQCVATSFAGANLAGAKLDHGVFGMAVFRGASLQWAHCVKRILGAPTGRPRA